MTVKDLRTLVDNLDEYIHVPGGIERLRKTVLHLAVSGQLVPQEPNEGTGEELYQQIQTQRQKLTAEGSLKKQKMLPEVSKDEAPFDVPTSWAWVRLGNIIELKSGADLVPSQYNDIGDGVPYITGASNIQDNKIIINRWTTEPRNLAQKNDLLLTCKGTIGAMAFLHEEEAHIARQLMALRFSDLQNPQYIRFVISTTINTLRQAAQSIIPGIARSDVLNIFVALPPLAEQTRIVEKVDVLFALIDELATKHAAEQAERERLVTSSLASLSRGDSELALSYLTDIIRTHVDAAQLRKIILRLAVTGKIVPQDRNEGTGEELYRQIKSALMSNKKHKELPPIADDDVPFDIPKSWKWVRLGDFYDVRDGTHDTPKYVAKGYPLVTSKNLSSGVLDLANVKYITETDHNKIKERSAVTRGDILFAMIGSIGNPVLVDVDQEFSIKNVALFKTYDKSKHNSEWLLTYLTLIAEDMRNKSSGAVQSFVSLGYIRNYVAPLPPLAEQERIVAKTAYLLGLVSDFELALETRRVAIPVAEEAARPQWSAAKQDTVAIESNEVPELTNQEKKVRRKMLACFIANESLDGVQFGKTKFEKLLHLIEYHVLKKDLNQRYSVQPAGPYDGGFTRLFWDDVVKSKWFKIEGHGNLQKIVAGDKHEKSQKDYGYLSDDEKSEIRDLLKMFNDWSYGEAEIISTLYAVWNNRLIKGEEVNDGLLKQDFLQWDPQKTQYSERLDKALKWMRDNNIVPDGWGNEIKKKAK